VCEVSKNLQPVSKKTWDTNYAYDMSMSIFLNNLVSALIIG
jgi:hypothetical protein